MSVSTRSPLGSCRTALIENFRRLAPGIELDRNGYVAEATQNLIPGVRLADFEADLRQGDGNELEGKFRAAHSSSALAVNAFAPFKRNIAALHVAGQTGFESLFFERKCHHGLAGRRSPNLDVLAEGAAGVVAIESKCLEYLTPHKAEFAPAYEREALNGRRQSAWFAEMKRLVAEPAAYRYLDAAQLVKHAFGLAYTFPERTVTLLYLFWEPMNSDAFPAFAQHRAEIARFKEAVSGATPNFVSMSYPELWDTWMKQGEPAWLAEHVARLRARYEVRV